MLPDCFLEDECPALQRAVSRQIEGSLCATVAASKCLSSIGRGHRVQDADGKFRALGEGSEKIMKQPNAPMSAGHQVIIVQEAKGMWWKKAFRSVERLLRKFRIQCRSAQAKSRGDLRSPKFAKPLVFSA
jgi:hypothetical protein